MRPARLACILLACALLVRAEGPAPDEGAPWLGRLVFLAVKDGALTLDQEAWSRWAAAQPKEDDSPEARRRRVAEKLGLDPEAVSDAMLNSFGDHEGPPAVTLFRKLMAAGGGRGGSSSGTSGTATQESADCPGFHGDLRLDSSDSLVSIEVVEEVASKRRLSVHASPRSGLSLVLQGEGTSIVLLSWPDGTVAVAATRGAETCRRTGRSFEEVVQSAPEEIDRCLARPLAEIGIALPAVKGLAAPKGVARRGLGATREEVERASVEAAKRVDTSIATLTGHSGAHHAVAFSPDGRTLLMGGVDDAVSLWDTATWEETKRFEHAGRAAAWSADGRTIAGWGGGPGLSMTDVASGEVTSYVDCHPSAAAFGPDGKVLFCSEENGGKYRVLAVEVASWRTVGTFEGSEESGMMSDFALAPDGKTLAAAFLGQMEGEIRLWDVPSAKLQRSLVGHKYGAYAVAFGKDGNDVFSGGRNGDLRRWDAAKGEVRLLLEAGSGSLQCLAASPAGDLVARGDRDGCAKIREAATGREAACFRGHRGRVESVAWSPDGRLLATGGQDGTVKVWRVAK